MTAGLAALATSLETGRMDAAQRLELLFDAHRVRLYRLARRLSSSQEDARDLVQETYLRAAQNVQSVPAGASHEEAWLVRVLVNLCRDRWRRHEVRRREANAGNPPAVESSGESARIAHATIWAALQRLQPRRRAILIMCELEGLSISSVARTLGVTAVTVRWHLSKGRRELAHAVGVPGSVQP